MIHFLGQSEAKVIGVDIIYSENDLSQGLLEVRDIIKGIEADPRLLKSAQINTLYASLKESEKRLDNDAILAAAMAESKKVILPLSLRWESCRGRDGNSGLLETELAGGQQSGASDNCP